MFNLQSQGNFDGTQSKADNVESNQLALELLNSDFQQVYQFEKPQDDALGSLTESEGSPSLPEISFKEVVALYINLIITSEASRVYQLWAKEDIPLDEVVQEIEEMIKEADEYVELKRQMKELSRVQISEQHLQKLDLLSRLRKELERLSHNFAAGKKSVLEKLKDTFKQDCVPNTRIGNIFGLIDDSPHSDNRERDSTQDCVPNTRIYAKFNSIDGSLHSDNWERDSKQVREILDFLRALQSNDMGDTIYPNEE
ncbi:hypothetical protein IWQ61_005603 [Dispira simplex]|nr:hypothetical protein IWQ61_005603 [Dispira simplex]